MTGAPEPLRLFLSDETAAPTQPAEGAARELVRIVRRLDRARDPVTRGATLVAVMSIAGTALGTSVREARTAGLSWRELGTAIGIPYQTLHRRYAVTAQLKAPGMKRDIAQAPSMPSPPREADQGTAVLSEANESGRIREDVVGGE